MMSGATSCEREHSATVDRRFAPACRSVLPAAALAGNAQPGIEERAF